MLESEKSVIDYLITCDILADVLDEMLIDEEREHVLTKYASRKGSRKKVESDHNIAKLSPSPNSNSVGGWVCIIPSVIQPPTHPATHPSTRTQEQ